MKEITYKDAEGNIMNVSLIGFFRIPDLEKEFIMYGLMDDDSTNENGYVMLGEVVKNENNEYQILGIDPNEKEMVLAYYNEISDQVGGADYE